MSPYILKYHYLVVDVDECEDDTDGCSQTCTNTKGSFTCGCNNGYVLNVDGTACDGMYMVLIYYYVRWEVFFIIVKMFPSPLCNVLHIFKQSARSCLYTYI